MENTIHEYAESEILSEPNDGEENNEVSKAKSPETKEEQKNEVEQNLTKEMGMNKDNEKDVSIF